MKKSRVLRAAVRKCLSEEYTVDKDSFLCNALDLYADLNPKARPVTDEIRRDIRRLLYPHSSVKTWLTRALNLDYDHQFREADLYAYRKRWAEHMAQQYEAQGD